MEQQPKLRKSFTAFRPVSFLSLFLVLLCDFISSADEVIFLDGYQDALSIQPSSSTSSLEGLFGQSSSFAVELWFRPERKEKDDHEEQCLLSQGSWEGRFKLSVLPWRTIRFTVRNNRGGVIDCDGGIPLQPRRWYHIGASYDTASKSIVLTLNGDEMSTTCNPSNAVERMLSANPNPTPLLVGCCSNPQVSNGGDHISGAISDLRYWFAARTSSQLQGSIHSRLLAPGVDNVVWLPLVKKQSHSKIEVEESIVKEGLINQGNGKVLVYGEPKWTQSMRGDQMLSCLLTGSERLDNGRMLSSYLPSSYQGSNGLREALHRYFTVKETERSVWLELEETRARLEAMGDFIAMHFLQEAKDERVTHLEINTTPMMSDSVSDGVSVGVNDSGDSWDSGHESKDINKIKVAIITPATTKGIDISDIGTPLFDVRSRLPLCAALLTSLYETCESFEFAYTVFLTVNEDDILADENTVKWIFDQCSASFLSDQKTSSSTTCNSRQAVSYERVVVPRSMIPSTSLSNLFNIPTLKAYAMNYDYFYLVNDDLTLLTHKWTSAFVDALKNNPLWPNLGVSGAVDVSDEITPQIEFPFFHRTHVSIFHWCGANPFTFRNWFEDNWITDLYIPFESVSYFHQIEVSNYGGLLRSAKEKGSRDPRYLIGGREVPSYYLSELLAGRRRVFETLLSWEVPRSKLPKDLSYCPFSDSSQTGQQYQQQPGTLSLMPVGPHQAILDPCKQIVFKGDKSSPEVGEERKFRETSEYMVKEVGHVSYGDLLVNKFNQPLPRKQVENEKLDGDNDNDSCLNTEDVHHDSGNEIVDSGDHSQKMRSSNVGLNTLVIHHHIPLVSRYGCDVRLLQVLESLQSSGHRLAYGGKHVSDFETQHDKSILKKMGVPLYAPLADGEAINKAKCHTMFSHNFNLPLTSSSYSSDVTRRTVKKDDNHGHFARAGQRVDVVVMTLWFWNTRPIPEDFLPMMRDMAPQAKVLILTDDVHYYRSSLMNPTDKLTIDDIKQRELSIYKQANAVACITREDQERIEYEISLVEHKTDDFEVSAPTVTYLLPMIATRKVKDKVPKPLIGGNSNENGNVEKLAISLDQSDTSLFKLAKIERRHRSNLVMVGNGANPGNKASADWFIHDVWPSLRSLLCDLNTGHEESLSHGKCSVKFLLVGADWGKIRYESLEKGIEVLGFLSSDELTSVLEQSLVFVSPIVASTGLNTKNLLALEHGVPLVTTVYGAEGMGLVYSEQEDELKQRQRTSPFFIGHDVDSFVTMVVELYKEPLSWMQQRLRGFRHLEEAFSLSAMQRAIDEIMTALSVSS